MSVDKYALCPCGSGKKIKFCKCKDSVSEMDRVVKMVEGGQIVPALDQLASILEEHPDAAWALALRGRLLLELREYESLAENADRFIRLQPSNPMALAQRAAAKLFQGDIKEATESIVQALTESGRDIDEFVLDVVSALAFALMQQGVYLTARAYATMVMMVNGYEGSQTAVTVLRQMNSSPNINMLMKSLPTMIERPSDVDWGERFDEAATLLQSNKIDLAESKFASLRRTVSQEPSVLSGLLSCAIWRGDVDAQAELLERLSTCESLDFEQRVRYRAMSALVTPETPELAVPVVSLEAELPKPDEFEMAVMADPRVVALPAELLQGMRQSEEDVPPRSGFQILDRDKPESVDTLPAADDMPEAIALGFIFGKQTDREARVELYDIRQQDLPAVRERLLALDSSLELKEDRDGSMPLLIICRPSLAMLRLKVKPAEAEAMQHEVIQRRMAPRIASLELPILDGKSLIETADDDSKLLLRTAVVRIVELYDAIAREGDEVISQLYQMAKIEPLPPIKPAAGDIETIANEDLHRVDPSELDAESLVYLIQRAQQVSASRALKKFASRLLEMELPTELNQVKLVAYMSLINAASRQDEALRLIDEAKAFADQHQLSSANLLLAELGLRIQAGDGPGFQNALQTLTTRYGQDPEVLAQVRQILMMYGLIGPDGTPRGAPPQAGAGVAGPAEPASGGKLWTPDSGEPANPPSDSGSGKLWVPGMD